MHRVNFSPTLQTPSSHGYQASVNFSMTSTAVSPGPCVLGGCASNLMIPVQMPMLTIVPPIHHPPNTPNNKVAVTYVHLMTVEETAAWIHTLGTFRGWKEAPVYAENFKKNSITGLMLQRLNHELLKFDLAILNSSHRLELLAIIRQLFPSFTEAVPTGSHSQSKMSGMLETDTESELPVKTISVSPSLRLHERSTPRIHKAEEYEPCMLDYLVKNKTDSVRMDTSSVQNSSAQSESGFSSRSSTKESNDLSSRSGSTISYDISESNLQKLPMIRTRKSFFVESNPRPKDITQTDKLSSKVITPPKRSYVDLVKTSKAKVVKTFSSTSSDVSSATELSKTASSDESSKSLLLTLPLSQVVRTRTGNIRNRFLQFNLIVRVEPLKKRSCWLIIFQSAEESKRALELRHQIGYDLEPYHDNQPRKLQRPTPRNPIKYRVLSKVTIRSGKSLHGDVVGELYKDKIITINKIKGRRARIIRNRVNRDPLTVGWVSSHTDQGIPLLEQM